MRSRSDRKARRLHGFESTGSARGTDSLVGQQAGGDDRRFRVDGGGPALRAREKRRASPSLRTCSPPTPALPRVEQRRFFELLATRFGPNLDTVRDAVADFMQAPDAESAARLHVVAEPRRQELIRRMNLAPRGTSQLVRMREDLLTAMKDDPSLARRCRLPPPVRLVVQPRLPRAADGSTGRRRRTSSRRSSATRPCTRSRAGTTCAFASSRRPALLRFLPPGVERRAADLRRGRAHAGSACRRSHRSSAARAAPCTPTGDDRGLLFDLELPAGPARHLLRQFPDQAGGRGPQARAARAEHLRHLVAACPASALARDEPAARTRVGGGPRCDRAALDEIDRPDWQSAASRALARRAFARGRALSASTPRTPPASRSIRSRASTSATAPASSGSTGWATPARRGSPRAPASWSTISTTSRPSSATTRLREPGRDRRQRRRASPSAHAGDPARLIRRGIDEGGTGAVK